MKQRRQPPPDASVAELTKGGRLNAPSAERNAQAITDLLVGVAPETGQALEIASGTGQHVAHWAAALPRIIWQPSDVDPERRASVNAWSRDLPNVLPSIHLDATSPGWADARPGQNLIVLVNLLHLISTPEARRLISETARALAPEGRFVLYGPFLRDGAPVSDADARFDASLRASDPEIGYKDICDVRQWLADAGMTLRDNVDMPANNLILLSEKP